MQLKEQPASLYGRVGFADGDFGDLRVVVEHPGRLERVQHGLDAIVEVERPPVRRHVDAVEPELAREPGRAGAHGGDALPVAPALAAREHAMADVPPQPVEAGRPGKLEGYPHGATVSAGAGAFGAGAAETVAAADGPLE